MRQLVENFAQENGVVFLPKSGRRHEGLQVTSTLLASLHRCHAFVPGFKLLYTEKCRSGTCQNMIHHQVCSVSVLVLQEI